MNPWGSAGFHLISAFLIRIPTGIFFCTSYAILQTPNPCIPGTVQLPELIRSQLFPLMDPGTPKSLFKLTEKNYR